MNKIDIINDYLNKIIKTIEIAINNGFVLDDHFSFVLDEFCGYLFSDIKFITDSDNIVILYKDMLKDNYVLSAAGREMLREWLPLYLNLYVSAEKFLESSKES